jgi:hypothetical protein
MTILDVSMSLRHLHALYVFALSNAEFGSAESSINYLLCCDKHVVIFGAAIDLYQLFKHMGYKNRSVCSFPDKEQRDPQSTSEIQ